MKKLIEVPLFAGMSEAEISQLLAPCEQRDFAEGEAIVREGEQGNSLFVIVEGGIEIRVDRNGSTLVVNRLEACTVVGEKAFIDAETRAASVIACTAVKAYEMAWPNFSQLLDDGSPLAGRFLFNIAHLMAQRMKILLDKFCSPSSGKAGKRELEQFRNKVFREWNF